MIKRMLKNIKKMIPWEIKQLGKSLLLSVYVSRLKRNIIDSEKKQFEVGVNLIGSIKAEMGLGQSCRLVAKELQMSQVPFGVFNIGFEGNLRENDTTFDAVIEDDLRYKVNLFHINPCELGKLVMKKPQMWLGHYNIAFWLWELEEFPKEWISLCDLFDEIWTPSDFAGLAVSKVTNVPMQTMPYSVDAVYSETASREQFGLPKDQFLFLVMYDLNSTNSRKNPQGAIEAYKSAFPNEAEDCGIVIKINNSNEENLKKLKQSLDGYKNVYFITEIMNKNRVNSLIQCVDVFVSLHRSEGFGLVMAEAMQLGTPCIATNYSSNVEFMNRESACMVDYKMTTIKKREGLYKKGYRWAEPDIAQAADFMKRLKEDKKFYMTKQKNGREYIEACLGEEKLVARWRTELQKRLQIK